MADPRVISPTVFEPELIRRHDQPGPRYTSYPTAVEFQAGFDASAYAAIARGSNDNRPPLSLYLHLPFCATVCYYCACNKIVTKNRTRAQPYLDRLQREITLQSQLFDEQRKVEQLHWGGGTPTFISERQMAQLMEHTGRKFSLASDDDGEFSIEIDPREASAQTVRFLRGLGFNRLSLGVQDFDPDVQRAVNRIQSLQQTEEVVNAARACGFRSVNVDLIYGLPLQTVQSFERTLQLVLTELRPDRVSVFNYAHLPERFKTQRQINAADLPAAAEKLSILQKTVESFSRAGYVYIGMDHFALPDDELAQAQRQRQLYRNFQGYSTHPDCDLVGLGITAIGRVGDSYSQNTRSLDEYVEMVDSEILPVTRGVLLTPDDKLRRAVISALICHFELEYKEIEQRFDINFSEYFAPELLSLALLEEDGLVRLDPARIQVTEMGRYLVRNICMRFDYYRRAEHATPQFSRAI